MLSINGRKIGAEQPVYIIAEMSANHNQDYNSAVELINAASEAGVDAVKFQTYTPDTLTIDSHAESFIIKGGTPWDGRTLYDLYGEAYTPWEWQPKLKKIANELGMDAFSTPFDSTSVDFLEEMDVPAYKVSSFEIVDIPLIKKIAKTCKPIIFSTGMATMEEIEEALMVARESGAVEIALLKCTSAYPAKPEDMNLKTIKALSDKFDVVVGLSDHTLGIAVPIAAVALGAKIIEKHFTMSRSAKGPDSAFSIEPHELKIMVNGVRVAEKALGSSKVEVNSSDVKNKMFRRSLFIVEDIRKGERFTDKNVKSIRPSDGLHPRHKEQIINKYAAVDLKKGTPLNWKCVK